MGKRPADLLSKPEFEHLGKQEKIDLLLAEGKYMHWKRDGNHNVLLYRLNQFYVKVFMVRSTGKLIRLETFGSDEGLMDFLQEVRVP